MSDKLVNDLGQNEDEWDDWTTFTTTREVESWGRFHRAIAESVQRQVEVAELDGAGDSAVVREAKMWLDTGEKFSNLAEPGLGFQAIWDFGPLDALDDKGKMQLLFQSAHEGKRILGELRALNDAPGGEEVAGATDNKPKPEGSLGPFASGAVLAGLGYLAYKIFGKE